MTPPHPAFSNLGLALQVVRHFSGQSQATLARKAGCGKSQLSKYENGKELPRLESLARLLDALGISPLGFVTVIDVLDRLGSGQVMATTCLLKGGLEPVITKDEQAGIHTIIQGVLGLFEAQIIARVKSANLPQDWTES